MTKATTSSDSSVNKKTTEKHSAAPAGHMTMEQLLQANGYKIPALKRGQDVIGKVVTATKSEILVDIGAKSEGIIYAREIAAAGDLLANIGVGDDLEATVIYPENDAGQVVLSLRKLSGVKRWGDLIEKKETGDSVEVTVLEVNRGGVICDYYGLRGFLPVSHLLHNLKGDLVGKRLSAQILEADKNTARLIFSQKQPEVRNLDEIAGLLKKVEVGEKFKGVISAILPFGLFVEIQVKESSSFAKVSEDKKESESQRVRESESQGVKESEGEKGSSKLEGLVHVSEVAWDKVDDLTKQYSVGQEVDVVIIAKDAEVGRLNLSMKQLTDDPFLEVSSQFTKDQKVKGEVSKVTPFGVFVSLEGGVEGLMHISKIPPNVSYEAGQSIQCEIESIDTVAHRISLVPIATAKPILYR